MIREACGIRWDESDIARFMALTQKRGSRLYWNGARSRGQGNTQWYGTFWTKGKSVRAHKFYGVAVLGLRPGPGLELDHEFHDSLRLDDIRLVTCEFNRARIRRPDARVLLIAKHGGVSPAEVMTLRPAQIQSLHSLIDTGLRLGYLK